MAEEKNRAILDKECINCRNFFDCAGKEYKGQLCIKFEERGEDKWPKDECSQKQ